jgi:hypothetical protein
MGYLQGRAIYVDRHLSNVALSYRAMGFIGDEIFPVVNVDKQSGMIKTYSQADQFRDVADDRAPGTEANKISFAVGSESYYADNHALKADVTIEDRVNRDPIFIKDMEQGRVEFITDKLQLNNERRIATKVTATANVSTLMLVASDWSSYAVATPLADLWTAMDQQRDLTGYKPNRAVFSELAFRAFSRNDEVIDKVHGTGVTGGGEEATAEQVAKLLRMEKVLVAGGMYNSAAEGIGKALTDIWGNYVLIYYAPMNPSVDVPSYGYSLRWTAAGLANWNVERHPYNTLKKTDEVEVGYYQDERVLATPLATLVGSTV